MTKPSERIKEIAEKNCVADNSVYDWTRALLEYLDEEHEKKNKFKVGNKFKLIKGEGSDKVFEIKHSVEETYEGIYVDDAFYFCKDCIKKCDS